MASLAQRGGKKPQTRKGIIIVIYNTLFHQREQCSTFNDTSTKNNEIRVLVECVSSFLSSTFTYHTPASKTELKVREPETSTILNLSDTICLKYVHSLMTSSS